MQTRRIFKLLPAPDVVQKAGAEKRFLVHVLFRLGNLARRACYAENVILCVRRVAYVRPHAAQKQVFILIRHAFHPFTQKGNPAGFPFAGYL